MPITTALYNLRRTSFGFLCAKFDADFNVKAVFQLLTYLSSHLL